MFDTVVRHDGAFEVLDFRIGRTNDEPSFVSMRVTAREAGDLTELLEELVTLGCRVAGIEDAHLASAEREGGAPAASSSPPTTQPSVRAAARWVPAGTQRMAPAIW